VVSETSTPRELADSFASEKPSTVVLRQPHDSSPGRLISSCNGDTRVLAMNSKRPLGEEGVSVFFVHTPDGSCALFNGFVTSMESELGPCFAIERIGCRDGTCGRLEDMATGYAHLIVCATVHFDLIGASFGGTLAHATSVAAMQLGGHTNRLVIVDPIPPGDYWFKRHCSSITQVEWRRIAATTLLMRSTSMNSSISMREACVRFQGLGMADIDVSFVDGLMATGLGLDKSTALEQTKQRLDVWVNCQLSRFSSNWGTKCAPVSCAGKVVVFSSRRDLFFGYHSIESQTRFFGSPPIVLSGEHLFTIASCGRGLVSVLNEAVKICVRCALHRPESNACV